MPTGELRWSKIRFAKVKNDHVHPLTKIYLKFTEILPKKIISYANYAINQ